jgi:hypothetical protein
MFTLQETFDMSCLALVEQGRPATEKLACRYLTADGRRCAIGHLMTDISPEVLRDLGGTVSRHQVAAYVPDHNHDLMRRLQRDHDLAAPPPNDDNWRGNWLESILKTARCFKVDPTRVLEAARAKGWTIPEGVS